MDDDAMLLFSLYDHDVITCNDFGGEALFPLRDVPGVVPRGRSNVGNFHGLKQVELALMFQENTGNYAFVLVRKTREILNFVFLQTIPCFKFCLSAQETNWPKILPRNKRKDFQLPNEDATDLLGAKLIVDVIKVYIKPCPTFLHYWLRKRA